MFRLIIALVGLTLSFNSNAGVITKQWDFDLRVLTRLNHSNTGSGTTTFRRYADVNDNFLSYSYDSLTGDILDIFTVWAGQTWEFGDVSYGTQLVTDSAGRVREEFVIAEGSCMFTGAACVAKFNPWLFTARTYLDMPDVTTNLFSSRYILSPAGCRLGCGPTRYNFTSHDIGGPNVDAPSIPAPGTLMLLGFGLIGLGWSQRKALRKSEG